jgi:hypothetical protein
MQNVRINKATLLPILVENKHKHDNIYSAAVSGYWDKAEKELNKKLVQVKKHEKIENYLGLDYPANFSDDYDRAIEMVKLSSDNELILTSQEFDCYVRNRWSWRSTFINSSTNYLTGMAFSGYLNTF